MEIKPSKREIINLRRVCTELFVSPRYGSAHPRIFQNGVESSASEVKARVLRITLGQLRHDAECLRISFETIESSLAALVIQSRLSYVAKGRVA